MRILYVDDCPALLSDCKAALEGRGYQVLTCSDCLDAVELVWQEAIDIAVIDNEMPEMNGIELAQVMRDMNPRIAILMYGCIAPEEGLSDEEMVFVNKSNGVAGLAEVVGKLASRLLRNSPTQLACPHAGSYLHAAWKVIGGE